MEIKHRDNQPIPGYPITATIFGSAVVGYPVSQLHPPVTATTNVASAASTTTGTTQNTDSPYYSGEIIKKVVVFVCGIFSLALLSISVTMLVAVGQIPSIPQVKLTSAFSTIHNISVDNNRIIADLQASFLVHNIARKGMTFDHLAASACQAKAEYPPHLGLCGRNDKSCNNKTVSFTLNNVSFGVESWDVVGKSGSSYIKFGLTATLTYGGKIWSKRTIPVTFRCEKVKIPFSDDAGSSTHESKQVQTFQLDNNSGYCDREGQWEDDVTLFEALGVCFLFMFVFIIVFLRAARTKSDSSYDVHSVSTRL